MQQVVHVSKSADLSRLRETKFFQAIGPDSKHAISLHAVIAQAQTSGKPLAGYDDWTPQARQAYLELTKLPRAGFFAPADFA